MWYLLWRTPLTSLLIQKVFPAPKVQSFHRAKLCEWGFLWPPNFQCRRVTVIWDLISKHCQDECVSLQSDTVRCLVCWHLTQTPGSTAFRCGQMRWPCLSFVAVSVETALIMEFTDVPCGLPLWKDHCVRMVFITSAVVSSTQLLHWHMHNVLENSLLNETEL